MPSATSRRSSSARDCCHKKGPCFIWGSLRNKFASGIVYRPLQGACTMFYNVLLGTWNHKRFSSSFSSPACVSVCVNTKLHFIHAYVLQLIDFP
jgi:hypothetical protein